MLGIGIGIVTLLVVDDVDCDEDILTNGGELSTNLTLVAIRVVANCSGCVKEEEEEELLRLIGFVVKYGSRVV